MTYKPSAHCKTHFLSPQIFRDKKLQIEANLQHVPITYSLAVTVETVLLIYFYTKEKVIFVWDGMRVGK